MKAFGLTSLALEWPEELTPMIRAFLASGTLADPPYELVLDLPTATEAVVPQRSNP